MNPELRFKDQDGKDFPDWEEKKIKEISIFRRGSFPQPYGLPEWYDEHNGKPFIQVADVTNNMKVNEDTNQHISKLAESKSVFVPKGSVIITIQGTIGRVAITPYDAYVDRTLLIIQSNKIEINKEYQIFALYNIFNKEKAKADGGILKTITKETLKNFIIPIPISDEQEKVARLLFDIDKKIESQVTLVEKLKNTKDAMFVKMFPQGDNVNPTLRFKKEDGSNYADWRKENLNKIASPKARIGWQGMRQSEFLDFGDYYLITGTDFDNGSINFDTCCYIEKYRYDQDKNIQVHNGDILITKDGTLGKVAYISNMDKPATLNAGVFVLNNLDEKMDSLFLYHYLAAPFLMEYANQQATGGTIKHLNQKVLVSFEVPIPEKEEQIKIGKCLSDLDKEIEINQQKYEKLCDVKKALLSKLFPTKEDE